MKLDVHTLSGDVIQMEAGPRTTIEEIQARLADACKVPVLCQHLALTMAVDMEPATKLLESKKEAKQIEGLKARLVGQTGVKSHGHVAEHRRRQCCGFAAASGWLSEQWAHV